MSRKICILTGTRAEYGLLRWVMEVIKKTAGLELQIVATGAHLSPEFGMSYREIEKDGFTLGAKVEMLLSADTGTSLAKSMGLEMIGMADALDRLKPDILVLLGDRYEVLAAASTALVMSIPIAHLHGGETSEGAFDEAIRHAVTKMSHLHFVAAEEYRDRVIQLGEDPHRVFLVGGLGVDAIRRVPLRSRAELEKILDFKFAEKNLLVTYHPVTLEGEDSTRQMAELLAALDEVTDTHLIFTMPNADTGSRAVGRLVEQFVRSHANARVYTSLGQVNYLSCLRQIDGVIGNSSSGLTEAPSFSIGTVNVGERQRGRLKAESVIDCPAEKNAIAAALRRLFSSEFKQKLAAGVVNPYGNGGASDKIVSILRDYPLENIQKKPFFTVGCGAVSGTRGLS